MACETCISHPRALQRILKSLASFHARARSHTKYPRDQADRSRALSALKLGNSLGGSMRRNRHAPQTGSIASRIIDDDRAKAAQQGQPNPNQAAGKAILQAADNAIGASKVNSYVASSTGWRGYPGQQFA